MTLIADGEHRRSVQFCSSEIVEKIVGVFVSGVEVITQAGVPGDVKGQAAAVVDGVEDPGGELEAYLHGFVVVINAIAEADSEVGFFHISFAKILDGFI